MPKRVDTAVNECLKPGPMKPAIAFGIHGSYSANDWEIIAITSEKARMVYGRDQHGRAMHAKPGDIHGRFKRLTDAVIGLEAIRALHHQHAPAIAVAQRELERLSHQRNNAIKQALANIRVTRIGP